MAKKILGDVTEGLFDVPKENDIEVEVPKRIVKERKPAKAVGRPKAADLVDEETVRKTVYVTKEQNKKVMFYAVEHDKDFSETIRMIIDNWSGEDYV